MAHACRAESPSSAKTHEGSERQLRPSILLWTEILPQITRNWPISGGDRSPVIPLELGSIFIGDDTKARSKTQRSSPLPVDRGDDLGTHVIELGQGLLGFV